jgi:Fe-S-cluster containining protein
MTGLDQRPYFFDEGIRFECRRCGDCCTGDPGIVRVNEREIADIAAYLGMPVSAVVETFLYFRENGHSIKEASDGRCLFFEDGCRIYPARPIQCRTFPFWFANLRSEARWNRTRNHCPGIGSGHLYTKNEILNILKNSM